jgi:sugar lactone lactonase YvrE
METIPLPEHPISWLDKPVLKQFPNFKIEHLLITIILIVGLISRFYNIGARDMSHDEVNHVVPSYELYQGNGYSHDPVTHGPMQFHLLAATYFLFGDTDYASRVPSALFSFATIIFVLFAFKRYLGRIGALLAGVFFLISPYMLFYGRYTRNESFVALFGVIMLFCVLYYLEKGKKSTLLLLTAVLSLQFCTKETSYIYTATLLIFLAIVFFRDVLNKSWASGDSKIGFSITMIVGFALAGLALAAATMESKASSTTQPFTSQFLQNLLPVYHFVLLISLGILAAAIITAFVFLMVGLHWNVVKNMRSFDLLILTFTLVLPLLTAFPIKLIGWDPLDYSDAGLIHTGIILVAMSALAILIGCLWKPSLWLTAAGIFYAIFTVLYTTFFTNAQGFFTGMVGSLGYWLSQQGVNRGTQPWFYYAFLQIPMYEFLPAIGLVLASIYGVWRNLFVTHPLISPFKQSHQGPEPEQMVAQFDPMTGEPIEVEAPIKLPVLSLLVFWSLMSLIAYSVAGEKMPWLTVHITLPMLLASGWGIGYLVESIPWKKLATHKGYFAIPLILVFLVTVGTTIGSIFGGIRPFSGTSLDQLGATGKFLFSAAGMVGSAWGVHKLLSGWNFRNFFKLCLVTFFGILAVLTARSAYQANYINYDNAKEFLVYAHGAAGPKEILKQVEEISQRTTGGKNIKVAYIGDALYPYWWYFRDYPNKMWIKDEITRDLATYPLVISDDVYLSKVQSVLGDKYIQYDYKRLWWPMMDYMSLTSEQVIADLKNPQMLAAIFDIWFNKDYTKYAQVTNNANLTLETWQPSASLHFFISKDIVAKIWDYGTIPATSATIENDPYAGKYVDLTADTFFGESGAGNGQLNTAHGIAIAPNGNIYIADSNNNRVQYFSSTGAYLGSWGTLAKVDDGNAVGGTFNEPWGIAIGPDGSVYVTDTWNYRIQKFTADGQFLTMWGKGGQGETPDSFWGPRGIAVDAAGRVFVTDTGNKRVVVFDADGNYLTQFGAAGMDNGQFDEPVGIAVDANGLVYVADTWNFRIQVFAPDSSGMNYSFLRSWTIHGWDTQSAQNKPFLALDASGNVFVTDPDNYRVLEFDNNGNIIQGWGAYSSGIDGFGMAVGITTDSEGHVWVVDAGNNYVLRFTPTVTTINAPVTSLPSFPNSPVALNFNPATNQLMDSLGHAYYTLDVLRGLWVPIVPDTLAQTLPNPSTPVINDLGFWTIRDANGITLYQWNEGALKWIAPEAVTATN